MKAETEAAWAERVEEWRKSGKTATDFAADKPYAGSTLQWAASRLHGAERGRRRGSPSETQAGSEREAIRLAKVVRRGVREEVLSKLVVEVAGARIAVHAGFDAALLSAVVRALKGER